MTSTAIPQNSTQATNTAAPSYASAASASKKPVAGHNTVVASGSYQAPAVVGSSATANAKSVSVSPVNGRPTIPPAVPALHGPSAVNGGAADHARKPSVTISANGPLSYGANGGPVGSKSSIQFGFRDSPVVSHSTPQLGASSPIPIPGSGNPRVASPAHSPSPIPQPAASGGRPPAGLQSGDAKPSFGSFNNDPEVLFSLSPLPSSLTAHSTVSWLSRLSRPAPLPFSGFVRLF
jgi:translation initiation factor 4G